MIERGGPGSAAAAFPGGGLGGVGLGAGLGITLGGFGGSGHHGSFGSSAGSGGRSGPPALDLSQLGFSGAPASALLSPDSYDLMNLSEADAALLSPEYRLKRLLQGRGEGDEEDEEGMWAGSPRGPGGPRSSPRGSPRSSAQPYVPARF